MTLGTDLLGAVDRGEIVALYQPQVDVASGRIVAVEALSRWAHPQLGILQPESFIPLAESVGLIASIGEFMLAQSCRDRLIWLESGVDLEVAVNVSARQLGDPGFFERVIAILDECSVDGTEVIIEITETHAIFDIDAVIAGLNALRSRGVGVSIDDFGTGHATVALVEALPVTEVKFDLSLVQEMSHAGHTALERAVATAEARGARTLAEGVETQEQLARVASLGIERMQGFYLSPPVSASEIVALALT